VKGHELPSIQAYTRARRAGGGVSEGTNRCAASDSDQLLHRG
jgi:hypothetical protein